MLLVLYRRTKGFGESKILSFLSASVVNQGNGEVE